ncbi:MAG: hypothetical protein Q4G11_07115, partial [Gallicola sp.]|nr:hypothetical protein [Gallicola sp.]
HLLLIYKKHGEAEYFFYSLHENAIKREGHFDGSKWVQRLPQSISQQLVCIVVGESSFLVRDKIHQRKAFQNHFINCGIIDKNDGLWLGTECGFIRSFSEAFIHYNASLLPDVWGVTQSADGKIWTCSYPSAIKSIEGNQVKAERLSNDQLHYYFHPALDESGSLYFPHNGGIIKRLVNGKIKELKNDDKLDPVCFYTFYDRQHRSLWGAFSGRAIVWNENGQKVRQIDVANGVKVEGNVLCIAQDSTMNYWLGGRNIYRYHWAENRLKQYKNIQLKGACYDMATDHSGTTWFATSNGLFYHDIQQDTLIKVNSPELNDLCGLVFPIDNDRLLTSQPDGLYVLSLKEFKQSGRILLSFYNGANGYLAGEPGQAGAFKDANGDIWITGSTYLSRM